MHSVKAPLGLVLGILCQLMFFAAPVAAQFKIEFQVCEDMKIDTKSLGVTYLETATCINPTNSLKPKGTVKNVHVVATFPRVPTGAAVTFMITRNDADGAYVENIDYAVSPQHTTAHAQFNVLAPGRYMARMVNY